MKKLKVIVCGAGIGGLTVAHELSKRNFDVTVYERNNQIGGLSRSRYFSYNNKTYPTEYSWRVYGVGYKNLLRLLKEIPLSKNRDRSVFDNLVKVSTYIFTRFDKMEVIIARGKNKTALLENFSKGDLFKILNKTFYCLTMSKKRMDSLDNLKWKDFCKDLSPEANKYMVRMWGPVIGMDSTYMSFPVTARIVGVILGTFVDYTNSLYLMNKPTNDGWFDEWKKYLQSKGVKIKTGHEILDFKMKDGKINQVLIKNNQNNQNNQLIKDTADYYICGLSVEAIAKIISKNQDLFKTSLKEIIPLTKKCRQVQLSVQIFLDQKLIYPSTTKVILYLPDSPWALIIEPDDQAWDKTYCSDKKVKTVLSVGICQTDALGILHQKPFTKCTPEEVKEEVWAQIMRSYKCSKILTKDGKKLNTAKIVLFYMWDSFKFDQKKKVINTWEPKFSNNAGSFKYQPEHFTEISNFLFATAYTRTNRYIYSMESAVESGTLSANKILKENNLSSTKIYPFSTSSIFLKPLILLDNLLFKLKLPHLSKLTFKNSLVLVGLYALGIILLLVLLIKWLLFMWF